MALVENLDTFLDAFGVTVTVSARSPGKGLLDMPGAILADGTVLSTEYSVTIKTDEFGDLKYGDALTISGAVPASANGSFTVRHALTLDDGAFTALVLSKV